MFGPLSVLLCTVLCSDVLCCTVLQDESDEMLNLGFKDQIYDIYRYLPPELQVRAGAKRGEGNAGEHTRAVR